MVINGSLNTSFPDASKAVGDSLKVSFLLTILNERRLVMHELNNNNPTEKKVLLLEPFLGKATTYKDNYSPRCVTLEELVYVIPKGGLVKKKPDLLSLALRAVTERDALSLMSTEDGDEESLADDQSSASSRHSLLSDLVAAQNSGMPVPLSPSFMRNSGSASGNLNQTLYAPSTQLWGQISPSFSSCFKTALQNLCCGCLGKKAKRQPKPEEKSPSNQLLFPPSRSQRANSLMIAATVARVSIPMSPELGVIMARVRNVFHSVLTPDMNRKSMQTLVTQLSFAISLEGCSLLPHQRFDLLINAAPEWASMMVTLLKQLKRDASDGSEPEIRSEEMHTARVTQLFWQCDQQAVGHVTYEQVKQTLKTLHKPIQQTVTIAFNENSSNGVMDYQGFRKFFKILEERPALREVFAKVTNGTEMTAKDLVDYGKNHQAGRPMSEQQAAKIINSWGSDFSGFCKFMSSPANSWWDYQKGRIFHDMSKPLTDYFISSSHNTYLSGDQLTSTSSTLMYKYALLRGIRCVEIDIWDGKDGLPVVTHGHTKTTRISFVDVIKTIDEFAFAVSKYPVILSLEVHAGVPQQMIMAKTMEKVFGKKLFRKVDYKEYSPEQLKYKILVKGSVLEADTSHDSDDNAKPPSVKSSNATTNNTNNNNNNPSNKRPIARDLADCVYLRANREGKENLAEAARMATPYQVVSLSEAKAEKMLGTTLATCTRDIVVRVYPKSTRVDSSNFDPQLFWAVGCQSVALNIQTPDYYARLNQTKFEDNGGCGYLLKPCWFRSGTPCKKSKSFLGVSITVLSGGNFPRSKKGMDPYVLGFVSGVPESKTSKTVMRTSSIEENGFDPTWNDKMLFKVGTAELAFITLRVMNRRSDSFVAEASVPVPALRTGIRSVPLRDMHGRTILDCFLLVDVHTFTEACEQDSLNLSSPRSVGRIFKKMTDPERLLAPMYSSSGSLPTFANL